MVSCACMEASAQQQQQQDGLRVLQCRLSTCLQHAEYSDEHGSKAMQGTSTRFKP